MQPLMPLQATPFLVPLLVAPLQLLPSDDSPLTAPGSSCSGSPLTAPGSSFSGSPLTAPPSSKDCLLSGSRTPTNFSPSTPQFARM